MQDMKKEKDLMKEPYPLTFGEEVGNSISHGVMFFVLLFTLPYYAIRAYLLGGTLEAVGISIYFLYDVHVWRKLSVSFDALSYNL